MNRRSSLRLSWLCVLICSACAVGYAQIEPKLDDIVRKSKACAMIPDNPLPGQKLLVNVSLPSELGGTGQCAQARKGYTTKLQRGFYVRDGRVVRIPSGGMTAIPYSPPPPPSLPGVCGLLPVCPPPISGDGINLKITSVSVKWSIRKSVNARSGEPLTENADFVAPTKDLNGTFIMAPLHFADLSKDDPTTKLYFIVAEITVSADKSLLSSPGVLTPVVSSPIPIEIPVPLSALQVPKVFVLFLDNDFKGAAAVYLPANSSLTSNTLKQQVSRISNTYGNLRDSLSFVGWFGSYLTGLDALSSALSLPHVGVKELKNFENNLNEDDFIDNGYLSTNDIEVEDESSSLLLLGVPGTRVQFFQDRSYKGKRFTVKTGLPMTVAIRNFKDMQPVPADGIESNSFDSSTNPNDRLSSFKWLP